MRGFNFLNLFIITSFLCIKAYSGGTTVKYYQDYTINDKYRYEGIHELSPEVASRILSFRFTLEDEQLVEIAYVEGNKPYSFTEDGVAVIKISYPEENLIESIYFNNQNQRTRFKDVAIMTFWYKLTFIRKSNYDVDRKLTRDKYGIYQYWLELNDQGQVIAKIGKDKKYNDILDNEQVYKTVYSYDVNGNNAYTAFLNKDGTFYNNQIKGYAIEKSIFDLAGNMVENRYYNANERPVNIPYFNCFSFKMEYDSANFLTETRYYDNHYKLTSHKDYNAAIITYSRNKYHQETSYIYRDTAENLTARKGFGFARAEVEHDSKGRVTKKLYYGPDNNLINIKHGYAIEVVDYDDRNSTVIYSRRDRNNQLIQYERDSYFYFEVDKYNTNNFLNRRYWLGKSMEPCNYNQDNFYEIEYSYTNNWKTVTQTFLDKYGRPQEDTSGVARIITMYNDKNFIEEYSFFNKYLEPVNTRDGNFAICKLQTDEAGTIISESFFGKQGEPTGYAGNGYHKLEYSNFSNEGFDFSLMTYLDVYQKPTQTSQNRFARRIRKCNDSGYLIEERWEDEKGNLKIPTDENYAQVIYSYDDQFRLIQTNYYDDQGTLANHKSDSSGYATSVNAYDENDHVYRSKLIDKDGKVIKSMYYPKSGNLFGIHGFELVKIQAYIAIGLLFITLLYFIFRVRAGFFKNQRAINYLIWICLYELLLTVLIIDKTSALLEQTLVFFLMDLSFLIIISLAFLNRRIIAALLFIVGIGGLLFLYFETTANYYRFNVWLIAVITPLFIVVAYLVINPMVIPWKKALFPFLSGVFLCAGIIYFRNPYTGDRWRNWEVEKIKSTDFLGQPERNSNYSAAISSVVTLDYKCEAGEFIFDAKARMNRFNSWKNVAMNQYLIDHEQTHFNITQIYTEILKRRLSEIENPCGLALKDLDKKVELLKSQIKKELSAEQLKYDYETEHGIFEEQQKFWISRTNQRLEGYGIRLSF